MADGNGMIADVLQRLREQDRQEEREDPLRASRGIALALLFSVPMWAFILWGAYKLVRLP